MRITTKRLTLAIGVLMTLLMLSALAVGYYLANQHRAPPESIQPISAAYLSDSKIFVVSANASYGNYPFPTVTSVPYPRYAIARNGEPCVIINVTLRNDYSTQNPAPNPRFAGDNSTETFIALTAQLFSGENPANATDITNAFPIASVFTNRAFTTLDYEESNSLSIYLATNSTDITSFQLAPFYVGLLPPP